ncbi:MAG: hypothetical protein ACLPTJ_15760 [Solirubrobacteraceae bacterium]
MTTAALRRLAAPLILTGALLPAAAAAATSHADLFQNKRATFVCGIEASALSRTAVLCSARGIPRPPHSSANVGDPNVALARTGRPQLVLLSQDSFAGTKTATLASGAVWMRRGVKCKVAAKTVTCSNSGGHGFTIGNGHYRSF